MDGYGVSQDLHAGSPFCYGICLGIISESASFRTDRYGRALTCSLHGNTRMWITIAIGFVFFTALAPFIFVAVGLLLAMPPRSWRGFVGAAFPRLNPPNDAQD
jgi:uncharacterized protein YjeT (DUF2065 family)